MAVSFKEMSISAIEMYRSKFSLSWEAEGESQVYDHGLLSRVGDSWVLNVGVCLEGSVCA
jgi:hypothetical protein